ncbi:MAG: zinc ribbon domain-containing protein [Prevotella sp.]|nr:zinc ribbon domain-containing protein [Prevotella sp.]
MAMIKCPECGHQTSDKAQTCPSCGIQIAGNIVRCSNCGEIYFKDEVVCPHCHTANAMGTTQPAAPQPEPQRPAAPQASTPRPKPTAPTTPTTPSDNDNGNGNDRTGGNKNNKSVLFASIVIALLVLGVCFYVYNNAQSNREQEEYEFAMKSNDPTVLQTYLDNYTDAPQEHRDSISAHLLLLTQQDKDWTDALVNNSKTAFENYLKNHPDSPHKQEAMEKIDSIDWDVCCKNNTPEAYQKYMDEHNDGAHYDEAQDKLKKAKTQEVTLSEQQALGNLFHRFFVSINSKDEGGLVSTVNDYVDFLGKASASKQDIVGYMHKLYKEDVEQMVWSLDNNYDISKREVGDEKYEYTVRFMALQKVNKTDGSTTTTKYKIDATVSPDGKITRMTMNKFVE